MKEQALLQCISLDGSKRYDLPAQVFGKHNGYAIFLREQPDIIHHKKNQVFTLPYPEIICVSLQENHVISVAINEQKLPQNMYVNINLLAEKTDDGFKWRDLELDLRFEKNFEYDLSPILVDLAEFKANIIHDQYRQICQSEISLILRKFMEQKFPFEKNEFMKLIKG